MEISAHIIQEAFNILEMRQTLPARISSAPEFFVAKGDDISILAFTAITHQNQEYKIGTKKQ